MMILPRVREYRKAGGVFAVGRRLDICGDAGDTSAGVNLLREYFCSYDIQVGLSEKGCLRARKTAAKEGKSDYYSLSVGENGIEVRYTTLLSFRDAAATLIALTEREGDTFSVPCCEAEDYAEFPYRGYMIDLARKYVTVEDIREQIVLLARAKYTVLHMHLLDTERYAIVTEAIPALNERPIFRQYSKDEMRALVAYAHSFGIEVLPEIDVPGHGLYLLDRLPQVRCEKDGEKIGIWDMCVASEETYRCIDLLVGELTEIFSCEYIHLGGDELSFYDMEGSGYWPNWYECDRCRALAEREGYTSASDYYCHFVRRVYDIVKKHGRKLMIWNDSVDISKSPDLPRDILIHFWRVACETRGPHEGCSMQRFLDEGFRVVNSFFEEVYADSYIEEEKLAVWTPVSDPPCQEKFAGQVVGGEICAWGIHGHFDYTLPVNLFLFADRLRNREPLDREAAQAALTRQLVSNEKGFPNIFRLLGGSIMPLDGIKKYRSAGNADKKSAEEAVEKVERKLSEGRGCRALLRGLVSCLEELRNDLG